MKHSILHIARVLAWFLVSLHSINLILKIVRNIGIDDGITNRNLMVIPYYLLWIGFEVLIAVQCGKLLKNNTSGN
tara:strand:+ start:1620 stop:1844 length:225 start_codon:yes stop_codon:yes gene_type:complete